MTGGYVCLNIESPSFTWTPGQHIYLSIPRLGLIESHPFTIMNTSKDASCSSATLFIKAHKGITRRLHQRALRLQEQGSIARLHAFVNGPYGAPPSLIRFDTVVFVATSTGISYTLPLFFDLASKTSAVQRIHFHWIVRHKDHIQICRNKLEQALTACHDAGVRVTVKVHLTAASDGASDSLGPRSWSCESGSSGSDSLPALDELNHDLEKAPITVEHKLSQSPRVMISPRVGRPRLDDLLRSPIEKARGETAIVGCGSATLSAELRNFTSAISDERAVHKGTGAQGIFLHVERYSL